MDIPLLPYQVGPYRIAFSTREGGVSTGSYSTLNLGKTVGDSAAAVSENRARLESTFGCCVKPTKGLPLPLGDVLITDGPGEGLLLTMADCLPIAIACLSGPPKIAVVHVGWRALLAGAIASTSRALGPHRKAAIIGPAIGPCCYEVSDDVARPFQARFGSSVVASGRLDLPMAASRALAEADVELLEHVGLCTACNDEFFSHRRDGYPCGRQGIIAAIEV